MSSQESGRGTIELEDVFTDFLTDVSPCQEEMNELELQVADKIETVLSGKKINVPKLPAAAASVMNELNDPEAPAEKISELVSSDAGLAADVLRLSNSALFNRGTREIESMRDAVTLIGLDNVKSVVAQVLMQPALRISPVYFKMFGQQLWDHSSECAGACLKLAQRYGAERFNAYLLGLIHDVGKMVIFQAIAEAFRTTHPDVRPRPHVFAMMIAMHATDISAKALRSWEFPALYVDALTEHSEALRPDEMSPLARTLMVGNLISEAHLVLGRKRLLPETVERVLQEFDISLDLVAEIFPEDFAA